MYVNRSLAFSIIVVAGLLISCVADVSTDSRSQNSMAVIKTDQASAQRMQLQQDNTTAPNDGLIVSLESLQSQLVPEADMEVIFSIENLTADDLSILPWGTPMEKVLSADIFDVVYQGEVLPYRGRIVKRPQPVESDFYAVPAGEKRQFNINLSQAYDSRSAGTYEVQLKSSGGFYSLYNYQAEITSAALLLERF